MYDILDFIDSKDIREYNRNTVFTPAQQAVLISRSRKKSLEEKMDALGRLVSLYTAEEFETGDVFCRETEHEVPIRQTVTLTIAVWREVLAVRYDNEGVVFAAKLSEKGDDLHERVVDYGYYRSYENAYQHLVSEKEIHSDLEIDAEVYYGEIYRIKLDTQGNHMYDRYCFDGELQLYDVRSGTEERNLINGEECCLIDCYETYIPLPFKAGDIVKEESNSAATNYAVISYDWKKPQGSPEEIKSQTSLCISVDGRYRNDYTWDVAYVLGLSYCTKEEVSESEMYYLGRLSAVRKGEWDFMAVLTGC